MKVKASGVIEVRKSGTVEVNGSNIMEFIAKKLCDDKNYSITKAGTIVVELNFLDEGVTVDE